MADNNKFSVFSIINPLISLYRKIFALKTASPTFSSPWPHLFFVFFHFLCNSSQQFTNFIDELAFYEDASTDLHYPPSFEQEQKFTTCPTVLLRAIVPSSGFTITFKAMLDSGAESSLISFDLARLLIKNGANWEYVWPKIGCYPFYELFTFHYRNICDLTLQSVENISVKMTTSIRVDECTPFFQDKLPFILIVNKMVSLGLPMIQSNERRLNDTMFSENDPE